jgi:hypothetical protein
MSKSTVTPRQAIVLAPRQGCACPMGRISPEGSTGSWGSCAMKTAMAIFENQPLALERGDLEEA